MSEWTRTLAVKPPCGSRFLAVIALPNSSWVAVILERDHEGSYWTTEDKRLSEDQLWINPDCGLKTRGWAEVRPALVNMVEAAREMRARA